VVFGAWPAIVHLGDGVKWMRTGPAPTLRSPTSIPQWAEFDTLGDVFHKFSAYSVEMKPGRLCTFRELSAHREGAQRTECHSGPNFSSSSPDFSVAALVRFGWRL